MIIEIFAAVAVATAPTSPAQGGGARHRANVVMPKNDRQRQFQQQFGYADAIVSNDIVYLSGVPAFLAPGETDMEKALTRAFEAMSKTLARAGVTWDDAVQVNSVYTDVNAQIQAMVKVKNRFMTGKAPAWTAVGTNGLLQLGRMADITLVAHVPRKAKP